MYQHLFNSCTLKSIWFLNHLFIQTRVAIKIHVDIPSHVSVSISVGYILKAVCWVKVDVYLKSCQIILGKDYTGLFFTNRVQQCLFPRELTSRVYYQTVRFLWIKRVQIVCLSSFNLWPSFFCIKFSLFFKIKISWFMVVYDFRCTHSDAIFL